MTAVVFSTTVGGDGSQFHDGEGAGGMANGGYLDNFFPLLVQYLAVAAFMVTKAQAASDAAASAANAPGTNATTSTSLSIGTGNKSFTLNQLNKAFSFGQTVVVASNANPANNMVGIITAFTPSTGAMTISVASGATSGSGTFSDWTVALSATGGTPPSRQITASGLATGGGDFSANRNIDVAKASADEIRAGTTTTKAMTPGDTMSALAEVTLQDGATITTSGDASLDMAKFINARVTLGGNRTLPNPINAQPGDSGYIAIAQDATGSRLLSAWGSAWRREGGKPTLSTAAGAVDYLFYQVITSSLIVCSFVKAPTN